MFLNASVDQKINTFFLAECLPTFPPTRVRVSGVLPDPLAGKCRLRLSQDGFPLGLHSNCLRRKKVKQICINSGRRPEEPGRGRAFCIHWYAPRGPQSLTCSSLVASEKINCHFLPGGRRTKPWPGGKAFPCNVDQEFAVPENESTNSAGRKLDFYLLKCSLSV